MRPHRPTVFLLLATLAGTAGSAALAAPQQAAVATAEPAIDAAELLPNGRQPMADILAGGQPTGEQLEEAGQLGYRTVINLRTEAEMADGSVGQKAAENLGMTHISIPVAGTDDLTRATAERFAAALEQAEGPTIVHCKSGNRVGALFALKAFYVDGSSAEEALELGRAAGLTRLEPLVRQRLEER